MLRHLKWLGLLVVLALAVTVISVPALAQQTGPAEPVDPQPGAPIPAPQVCVPAGMALAVLSQDGTVADVLPPQPRRLAPGASPSDAAELSVTLPGPGAVGACAGFQGFWGPGAAGTEAGALTLYRLDATAGATGPTPTQVATDGERQALDGPATFSRELRAITKIDRPGTYHFVAVLEVSAQPRAATGTAAAGQKDSLRVPFMVIVQTPPPQGAIEGTVTDADGNPIAGAAVMVAPPEQKPRTASAQGAAAVQPMRLLAPSDSGVPSAAKLMRVPGIGPARGRGLLAGAVLEQPGGAAGQMAVGSAAPSDPQAGVAATAAQTVTTDEKGHYRIELPAGTYLVLAKARGYVVQFYNGKETAAEADIVAVKGNATTGGIDFHLAAGQPPVPAEHGTVAGKVMRAEDGSGIEGATVVAFTVADPAVPGSPRVPQPAPAVRLVATTNAEGGYKLEVPVGTWTVMASAAGYEAQCYEGQADCSLATPVVVKADEVRTDVDFKLTVLPEPEPAPYGTISGRVTQEDGSTPIAGASVQAMASRSSTVPPGGRPLGLAPIDQNPGAQIGLAAVTKDDGTYELKVPVGTWLVTAMARGYVQQWYDKAAGADGAKAVAVAENAVVENVDFALAAAPAPQPPDTGIAGKVTAVTSAGIAAPVAGVSIVVARLIPSRDPTQSPTMSIVAMAMTDGQGDYLAPVEAGKYLVGLVLETAAGQRMPTKILWYDNVTVLQDATEVTVAAGAITGGIDFLSPTTNP